MIFCRFLGYQFTKYGHYVFSISDGDLNKRNGPLNKVFPKVNIIIPISLISYLLKSDRTDRAFGKKLAYLAMMRVIFIAKSKKLQHLYRVTHTDFGIRGPHGGDWRIICEII